MTAAATPEPTPIRPDEVVVTGDAVLVHELTETDPDVVRVVGDADDAAEAVHRCLRIGAVALRASNVSVDVDMVERKFDGFATRIDGQVTTAVTQIEQAAKDLLDDEDGALRSTLTGFHTTLDDLLGKTFDPDSKSSVLAKIEDLVEQMLADAATNLRKLVAVDGDDSPLARLKRELLAGVKEQTEGVVKEVRDVQERLGIAAATAEVYEQTSGKGRDFETIVHETVAKLAASHGDIAEHLGDVTGATGGKVGDEVVTLNRDDCLGYEACFVLEVKAKKLGTRAIHSELDRAMENREATAAIAVFRSQDLAPTAVPFHYADDKAIVVFDGDDDGALRLAYMWARWVVRRSLGSSTDEDELDHERIGRLLQDASRALEHATTVRRNNTNARKAIDQAGVALEALVQDVDDALTELAQELGIS